MLEPDLAGQVRWRLFLPGAATLSALYASPNALAAHLLPTPLHPY